MVLHNPNNWHWVDKNCIYWSREYFTEKLIGLSAEDEKSKVKITALKSLEGDVDVSQRKGKVISLFDLKMELEYKGSTTDEDDVSGQISVPEIAYDTEEDEYNFNITITNDKGSKEPVKTLIRKQLIPKLRKLLNQFGRDLIETHGKDIQHPSGSPLSQSSSATVSRSATPSEAKPVVGTSAYNTTSLHFEPVFNTPANQIYDAFTKPEMVAAWTRSKPDIEAKEGSEYSLFGGNITGKIVQLKQNELIEQTWRLRDWKAGHYAKMILKFETRSSETVVKVDWSGIPIGQEEVVEKNFEEYYVKSIKLTFGFGAVL